MLRASLLHDLSAGGDDLISGYERPAVIFEVCLRGHVQNTEHGSAQIARGCESRDSVVENIRVGSNETLDERVQFLQRLRLGPAKEAARARSQARRRAVASRRLR